MEGIDDWTTWLAAQAGIVTCAQLLARGITDDTVRAHGAAGRWLPAHLGVYATFSGPLSPDARRWAAVLACRPSALIDHIVPVRVGVAVVSLAHTALDLVVAETSARAAMRSLLRPLVTTHLRPDEVRVRLAGGDRAPMRGRARGCHRPGLWAPPVCAMLGATGPKNRHMG